MARCRVAIVEPISSGVDLLEEAKAMGLELVVVTFDEDDRRLSDRHRRLADDLIVVDTNDEVCLLKVLAEAHRLQPLHGIVPGFEFYVPAVARVAAELGLPGLPVENVEAVRDKGKMRERVAAAGLRVPRHAKASSEDAVVKAAGVVGFPAVLKPVDSSGSIHVSRVDDLGELVSAYRALVADSRRDLGRVLSGSVLLEEYVSGPEFSVEGYALRGSIEIVSVTEKHLGPEPYFVEVGHVLQASLSGAERAQIVDYVASVARALGVTCGVFHCEVRWSSGSPVLIELGARLPGDHISELVLLATGISLPRAMLSGHIDSGYELDPRVDAVAHGYAGIRFLTAPGRDSYGHVEGLREVEKMPGFVEHEISILPGEHIPPPNDFRCRIGHVMFTASSYEQAADQWDRLGKVVSFA